MRELNTPLVPFCLLWEVGWDIGAKYLEVEITCGESIVQSFYDKIVEK